MQWETRNFKPSSKEGCGQQCIWAKGAVSPGASCLFPGDGWHDLPGQALCSRGDPLCVYHGPGSRCSLCCAWPHWSILSQWLGWAVSRWKEVWPCLRGDWGPGREFLHHARQHSKQVSPGARSHLAQQLSVRGPSEADAGGLGTFLSYHVPAGFVQYGRESFCWRCESQNTVLYCLVQ